MHFPIRLCLVLCLLAGPTFAVSLTLEHVPVYALAHNPTLAAARLRIDEARGRLRQSGRLTNPELELEFSHNTTAPEGALALSLMQKFPLTSRLRLERAVSRAQLAAAEAEVHDVERKTIALVRTAAVRVLALSGQHAVRAKQLANSREIATFTRKRLETGEASAADAEQLDLDAHVLETEMLQLGLERVALLGELRPLLGVPAEEPLEIRGELAAPSPPAASGGIRSRPDFEAAQHTAAAARATAALARAQKWEDIGIGITAQRQREEDAPEGRTTEDFVGLRLSVPLPLWNTSSGRAQEAAAAAARAQKETDALAATIAAEASAARNEMRLLAELLGKLDATLLPHATQIEERLRQSYATGQTALTDVLRGRDRRLLLERQRLDALRDYHLARVRHNAAIGPGVRSAITTTSRSGK